MEQEPGSWHDGEEIEEITARDWPDDPEAHYLKAEPSFSEDLIKIYGFFQQRFGIPQRVFYPCCDLDASPVKAFPDSEVTLLDINDKAVAALNSHGIEAIAGDVRKYKPDEMFDLLILLNPDVSTRSAIHTLKRGGYVLANDWHDNTTEMLRRPWRYEFQGTIHHGKDPMEMLSKRESRKLLRETDSFINLYSIFTKRF